MSAMTDADLYRRGAATMLAAWAAVARGCPGAVVVGSPGFAAAVFPAGPEREYYNNALLERDLGPADRAAALDALAAGYAAAGITDYRAWVHESDRPMRAELAARGYTVDEVTRAMGMDLTDVRVPRPGIEPDSAGWSDYLAYLRALGAPDGLLAGVDPAALELLMVRRDGEWVSSALALDLGEDRGIYNVATAETARRRGLGTALTALLVHDAAARGQRTASLQSTEIAERIYAAIGFRDLGRLLEYAPGAGQRQRGADHADARNLP